MTTSLLGDASAHNVWATERLIVACSVLTSEQLETPAAGTFGPIIHALRHLVASDTWAFVEATGRPRGVTTPAR